MKNKFDYTNTPEEITDALFNYIGYVKSDNEEQFYNIAYQLYNLLWSAENPYNHDSYRDFYSILDEFVEVYKERRER